MSHHQNYMISLQASLPHTADIGFFDFMHGNGIKIHGHQCGIAIFSYTAFCWMRTGMFGPTCKAILKAHGNRKEWKRWVKARPKNFFVTLATLTFKHE